MSGLPTTVLITGADRGLGLALVRSYLGRGDQVYVTYREKDQHLRDLKAEKGTEGLHLLPLEQLDDTFLIPLLEQLPSRIDRYINLAGMRQLVRIDRLTSGCTLDMSYEILPTLLISHALLGQSPCPLSPKAQVICVASSVGTPRTIQYGSLDTPPRVSPSSLLRSLQSLAAELLPKRGVVALLYPGQAPLFSASDTPREVWLLSTIDQLSSPSMDRLRPGPLFLRR